GRAGRRGRQDKGPPAAALAAALVHERPHVRSIHGPAQQLETKSLPITVRYTSFAYGVRARGPPPAHTAAGNSLAGRDRRARRRRRRITVPKGRLGWGKPQRSRSSGWVGVDRARHADAGWKGMAGAPREAGPRGSYRDGDGDGDGRSMDLCRSARSRSCRSRRTGTASAGRGLTWAVSHAGPGPAGPRRAAEPTTAGIGEELGQRRDSCSSSLCSSCHAKQ
ncbi:hypothetical protein U9M48_018473, partial [Paspalum notatum var. saurae]